MIATSQFTISVINDGAPGATGPQGVSVTKVVEEYRLSNSNTELTGSGTGYTWSETKPDIPSGKYLWIRERTDLSNNTSSYGTAHCDIVISGLVQDVNRNSGVITSKVWESYTQNSINEYDGSTGAAIRDRVTQTETSITGITSRVSDVESETDSLGTRMTSAESSITQNADNIALMVTVDGTSSSLTLTQNMLTAMTSQFVVKDPAGSATIITGGKIQANSITTNMLKSDAIKSTNYTASSNVSSPYSATGAFLDLNTGSLYMPNFGVNGTTGASYFNGTVNANAGKFGDNTSYWNIETVYDYNMQPHAALVGTGSPYLQTGNWQVSDNAVATRKYTSTDESTGNATYYKDSTSNTFYDVGMKIPTNFGGYSASDSSVTRYNKAFYYGRKYTGNSVPSLDSDWTYFFEIDSGGNIITAGDVYEGGVKLSEKYAAITDVGSAYLPKTGGTITGNLSVNGSFTTNLMLQTNLGSTSSAQLTGAANAVVKPGVTGTLGVGNGGTGKSSWTANRLIYSSASNALSELGAGSSGQILKSNGSSAPSWVNQSTLSVGSATKATQDGDGNVITDTYRALDDNQFDTIDITDAEVGNLIVKGAARFTNGLYGTASEASKVTNALTIQLNGGTTEGTNQFTYDGSAVKNINITRSSIGLGAASDKAVDTSIAASSSSTNLPTSAAVASFVEGKGYVTSSGVTSVRVQATTPVVSSVNTAQSSTLNTTISLADSYGDTKNPYGTKTANYVLAGPSSGSAATPTFRKLVAADIPSLTKSKISDFPTTWALTDITGADDLKAIEGLTGASGILKKTAANTWALSTVISGLSINNDVLTVTKSDGTTQDLTINITGQVVSGATILSDASGNPISEGSTSKPVYFSNGVPVSANTIPTIALNGSNTTSPSFYAPTGAGTSGQYLKSNGSGAPTWATFSKSTVGLGNVDNTADANKNVLTATKFAAAQSVTLTGDTTGTASSQAGWSIATTTNKLTSIGRLTSANVDNSNATYSNKITYFLASSSMTEGKPPSEGGILNFAWSDNKWGAQLAIRIDTTPHLHLRGNNNTSWDSSWLTVLDSNNYNAYAPKKDGTGATGTWGISISGNAAAAATSAALTGITSNRFVIGNGTSSAYASSQMSYFNNVDLTVASTTVKRNGIHIWGQTYGNDATKLVSQTAGVMSWGDGGPQITFNSGSATPENGQAGALIFTDHDSCGTGASFHFVSNQTDWNVNSKRFVAKTSMTVGANVPNTSYNLSVTGTANISGATTGASFSASDYISANNGSGTAGGVNLYNRSTNMEYAIMFRTTATQVKHGYVQGDFATYLTMSGNSTNINTRGWIFKDHLNSKGVASISTVGHAVFNGSVTVGGNATNTSGCRQEFDANLQCLNFIFN